MRERKSYIKASHCISSFLDINWALLVLKIRIVSSVIFQALDEMVIDYVLMTGERTIPEFPEATFTLGDSDSYYNIN